MSNVSTPSTTAASTGPPLGPVDEYRWQLSRLALEAAQLGSAQKFHQQVRARTGAVSSFEMYFAADGTAQIDRAWSRGQLDGHARYREQVAQWCHAAKQSGSTQVGNIDGYELTTFCAPIRCFEKIDRIWIFVVPKNEKVRVAVTRDIEVASGYYGIWRERYSAIAAERHAAELADVLDLLAGAQRCETVDDACRALAAKLQHRPGVEGVAILVGNPADHKLAAISGLAGFDPQSKTALAYREACLESFFHPLGGHWPPSDDDSQHCLLAHRRLAEATGASYVESLPLTLDDGKIVGALVWLGRPASDEDPRSAKYFAAVSLVIAEAICNVRRMQRGRLANTWRKLQLKTSQKQRAIALWTAAALCLAMFIPLPYKVRCTCQAEPMTRRFAVAPYDGIVERGYVKPGDMVRSGQVLARMDARELAWELQGVIAEQRRAAKESDVYLSDERVPEAMMSRYDSQRLLSRQQLLENRQSHLEICAPIDGFVLAGDLELSENAPVKTGDTLYEIGPASPIKIQLQIPADDVRLVRAGHTTRIWISGLGATPLQGRISRVLPRSQVIDGKNVFIAEVEIGNEAAEIRPGMKGIARVSCDYSLLGWTLFHKPWEYIASRLSW
jgi:hypothetical protein